MFAVFPVNVYDPVGYPEVECAAYLGVVTMLLIGYSAFHRVTFSRSRFWWLAFGGLAVLSMGAYWRVGSHKIPMPGLWLREYVPIFQSIRVPARFNLLVCGIAAVLAGSGLVRLLARFRTPRARGAVFGSAIILLVADMNMVPFSADTIRPTMPACYAWIRERNPRAALLEAPVIHSGLGRSAHDDLRLLAIVAPDADIGGVQQLPQRGIRRPAGRRFADFGDLAAEPGEPRETRLARDRDRAEHELVGLRLDDHHPQPVRLHPAPPLG